jgi:hypothetical protein
MASLGQKRLIVSRERTIVLTEANPGPPQRGELQRMARKRLQRGSLKLIGKRRKQWQLKFREDVIRDERRVRVGRTEILGTLAQYPTKKLAQRAADERLQKINSVVYRPPVEGTFAQFGEQFLRDVLSQKKFSTQTTERSRIKKHLLPAFGGLETRSINPADIQQFIAGAGRQPKSIRNCIATLRMMWNSAKAWGYTSMDWFDGISLPEYVKPEAPHFTLEEMKLIITGAEEPYQSLPPGGRDWYAPGRAVCFAR